MSLTPIFLNWWNVLNIPEALFQARAEGVQPGWRYCWETSHCGWLGIHLRLRSIWPHSSRRPQRLWGCLEKLAKAWCESCFLFIVVKKCVLDSGSWPGGVLRKVWRLQAHSNPSLCRWAFYFHIYQDLMATLVFQVENLARTRVKETLVGAFSFRWEFGTMYHQTKLDIMRQYPCVTQLFSHVGAYPTTSLTILPNNNNLSCTTRHAITTSKFATNQICRGSSTSLGISLESWALAAKSVDLGSPASTPG